MFDVDTAIAANLYNAVSGQPLVAGAIALVAEYGIFLLPLASMLTWFVAIPVRGANRVAIFAGCIAAVVAAGLGYLLEHVLTRPRPFVELGIQPLIPHAADSSFPSDHTLVGVALVGVFALRVPHIGGWLLAWALMVGFARVAAGLHYPTDIVGSAVLALALDLVAMSTVDHMPRLNRMLGIG